MNSMLKECDTVVVCVPLTKETQDLIGEAQLAVMKQSAYLVDVSRGGVINHANLIPALNEGQIAGRRLMYTRKNRYQRRVRSGRCPM